MNPDEEIFLTPAQAVRAWMKKHAALRTRAMPLFFMLAYVAQGTRKHAIAQLCTRRKAHYDNGRRRVNELVKLGYVSKCAPCCYTITPEGLAAMGIRAKKGAVKP